MADQIIFLVLAAVIVLGSILTVTTKLVIRSATYLLFVLLATGGLYLQMDYPFLAAVQVAVYGGGIMVLFIFSILLTNNPGHEVKYEKLGRMVSAGLLAFAGLAVAGHIIYHGVSHMVQLVHANAVPMQEIGADMVGSNKFQYMLPFEAVSLLLLACIIGGIMIARKR